MSVQVLIAESHVSAREALGQMAELCGCKSVVTVDVADAIGALNGIKFDILITGITPNDPRVAGLVYAARTRSARLGIVAGKTYAAEIPTPGAVNIFATFPLNPHELRLILQEVLDKALSRYQENPSKSHI